MLSRYSEGFTNPTFLPPNKVGRENTTCPRLLAPLLHLLSCLFSLISFPELLTPSLPCLSSPHRKKVCLLCWGTRHGRMMEPVCLLLPFCCPQAAKGHLSSGAGGGTLSSEPQGQRFPGPPKGSRLPLHHITHSCPLQTPPLLTLRLKNSLSSKC